MPLTPEDVQNKRFTTVRFKEGYDEEEVDGFLDEVEAELRRLLGENEQLRRAPKPAAAPAPVAPAAPAAPAAPEEQPQEAALRTLLLAQRTADEAIAEAKAEAAQMSASAKAEADQIVSSARMKAAALEAEAQQQHAAAVADLQRQRNALEAQIDSLRGFEREYRTRLKAYLEGQLRELESQQSAAPAPPPSRSASSAAAPPPAASSAPQRPATPRADVPGLAPPPSTSSPFSPAPPPLVEDVDTGSDAPTGPPREPGADGDFDASGGHSS